jgi:hypothetical protein
MPFRPVRNPHPGQGAMTGRRRGPRPAAGRIRRHGDPRQRPAAPAAILLSASQQVGTDVTGPNISS